MVCKLILDLSNIDLNTLCDELIKKNIDLYLTGDEMYLHTRNTTLVSISMLMKKMKITNFFLKEIKEKPHYENMDASQRWVYNKIQEDENKAFDDEHQDDLRKMMDNIQKIREIMESSQRQQKEANDGNSGIRDARKTETWSS